MKVILEPKSEKEILKPTTPETTPREVHEVMAKQAPCCVDHLCGCNCGC